MDAKETKKVYVYEYLIKKIKNIYLQIQIQQLFKKAKRVLFFNKKMWNTASERRVDGYGEK